MAKRMRRIYRAKNGVVDGSDFWISDSAQPRRSKTHPSTPRKQEANRNQAAHILARKLNNNFEQGDLLLTLTWDGGAWQRLRHAAYQELARKREADSSAGPRNDSSEVQDREQTPPPQCAHWGTSPWQGRFDGGQIARAADEGGQIACATMGTMAAGVSGHYGGEQGGRATEGGGHVARAAMGTMAAGVSGHYGGGQVACATEGGQGGRAAGDGKGKRCRKDPTGKNPTGKNFTSKNPMGKNPTGKNPAGKDPTGKNPAGKDPTGRKPTRKNPTKEEKRDAILFQAEKEGKLLIRRLREAGARDLKYMILASDMDGKTGDEARVHLHVILSGDHCSQEKKQMLFLGRPFSEYWTYGAVEYEYLRAGSYAALARYLIRQTRDIPNHKRYVCSRNLEPIEYEEIELDRDAAPLQAPAGAEVEEYQNDPTNPYGMVYIRYIEPPKDNRRRRKQKDKEVCT